MNNETRELVERRFEQIRQGLTEAIQLEVEWLERHNFPVWFSENGDVTDATKTGPDKEIRQ